MKKLYRLLSSVILLMVILNGCQQSSNPFPKSFYKEKSAVTHIHAQQAYANNIVNRKANSQIKNVVASSIIKNNVIAGEQNLDEAEEVDEAYDNIIASEKYEFDLVKNPATGKIPDGIIERSYLQGRLLPTKEITNARTGNLNTYTPAGPDNLGGRTRAFAYDVRFATNQVMIAGSVSSGVMRSSNGGASWTLVTGTGNIHDITCIAQDPRPGQQDTWYLGTGEALGNTSGADGAFRVGYGVYKSTDNGLSWARLPNSNVGVYETFDTRRDLISRIVVNPMNGDVYMANVESISRSTDGGNTWSYVLGLTSGSAGNGDITDIVCSSSGVLYAAMPGTTNQTSAYDGVWTSTTGVAGSWTRLSGNGTPSDWKTNGTYGRIVLALAPSNENILYALYDNQATGAPGADFFKYDASTSTWSSNRSSNLPNEGGSTGTFNTQGGYDLAVTVKPDNPNFVIIGGTCAYTSTDGFSTATSFKRIGGYASPTTTALYPNHHPDLHKFVFEPLSNIRMVSADDGGLQLTTDVTASTVSWSPLNNGYQTYQYYYAAIDPTPGSTKFIGGAQDNGTTYRNAGTNTMLPILPGDGGSVGISASNSFHYGTLQNGDIYRRASGSNPNTGFSIKPSVLGTAQGLFITLFHLDPDNTEDLYYANANRLFRTSSASTVTTSAGWVEMTGVSNAISGNIRSFATTRRAYDSTHCLYIGTSTAKIFRVTNPRNADPLTVPTDITPTDITSGSTVIGIAVAPDNDDTVMAVISNYGAKSVFWTGNATAASPVWYNVEGTGSGKLDLPSFRACAIIKKGASFEYYVGTSVGLFSTTSIDGTSQATADNTSWTREGTNVIDQAVVVSLPVRNVDNTMLVATHGNGMFVTSIGITPIPPIAVTNPATAIIPTGAVLNGTVNDNGLTTTVSFDYGTSATLAGATNVAATTGANIAAGTGNTAVAVTLTGLTPNTTYYFRVKATNSAGTTFGNILSFTTPAVLSNDATLSNLTANSGTLNPVFSSAVTSYTISATNNTTSITVTPTKNNANATITVNGVSVASGTSTNVPLNVGSNVISIVVTAQDGTTKTYTITVTRAAPVSLVSDYFRSKQTGNWNDANTWETSSDNVNWISATVVPDFNSNIITVRSTHTVTITSNITIDQTIINSGGSVVVNPNVVLTINDGAGTDVTISAGANVLLRSTATGTAMIGNSSGTVSGDVTVERFIGAAAAKSAWRLLTAPLRSTTASNVTIFDTWQNKGVTTTGKGTRVTGPTGGNGLDAITFGPGMKWFDGKDFQPVTATNNPAITPLFTTATSAANNSYLIFIDGDRNASPGSPNTTTLSATGSLQMGDQTFATNNTAGGFTLIGNPFASPVDLDLFRTSNTGTNIKSTYYYCDPYLSGTYGYGGYVTVSYDGNGSSYTITPSGVDHTRVLQSGQAMFVQTNSPATGTASVTFKEAQKSTTNVNNIFRTPPGKIESLEIDLSTMLSGIPVLVDGIVAKFDNVYSAAVDDFDAEKMYNVGESLAFIRDSRSLSIERRPLIKSDDVLYLNLAGLVKNQNYQFEINADLNAPSSKAWLKDNYLHTLTPVNISGTTVINFTVNNDAASTGANRFSIVFKDEILPMGKPVITLYPNPIASGVIKVEFKNMPNGIYKVKMLNSAGQTVSIKQLDHISGNSTEIIQLPKAASGIYNIEIVKPDRSIFSSKVVIN